MLNVESSSLFLPKSSVADAETVFMNCPQTLRKTRATSQIYPLIAFWLQSYARLPASFLKYKRCKNVLVCHKEARHAVPCETKFDLSDNKL